MEQLSDDEVKRMLMRSGVPISYQKQSTSLTDFGDLGEEVKQWLEEENMIRTLTQTSSIVEFVASDLEEEAVFFMLARALTLHAVPVHCLHAQEICPPLLDDDVWEAIDGVRVLFVEGLATGLKEQFDTAQRGCLEWFLGRWLANGHSLIILNDRKIENADEFSPRFRKKITTLTKRQFKKG